MNPTRSTVLASLQEMNETYEQYAPSVIYRNLDGDILSAPRPTWQPRKGHETPGQDDFVVLDTRRRRRLAERAQRTAQRKGKRNYVRSAMRKAETATDLAQFFNIIDGLVPARPIVRVEMKKTIAQKVKAIVDADQARYDREMAARRKDRTLDAPQRPVRREDVEARLRGAAKTATTYGPRSPRDPDLVYPFTRAEEVALTTGRTGRAG